MRKKVKRYRVLILAFSILMSFCLTYPQYDNLGEMSFLSFDLTLESPEIADQEDLVMDLDPTAQSKEILSASFVNLYHPGIHPFQDSFPSPFQPFFVALKISILRC